MLLLFAFLLTPDDPAKELQRFVGAWELVEVKKNGKVEEEPLGGKTIYHFAPDGTYIGKAGDTTLGKGTFKPLPNTTPAAIDWTTAGRSEFDGKFTKDYPSVGIYEINGDTLTIALLLEGKPENRPKDFDCKEGSNHSRLRLKRFNK